MQFCDRLKSALAAADKTQRDLSKHLRVAESTVSQWASGKRLPDLLTANRLASYLNVSIDYLMGRTADPEGVARATPGQTTGEDELYVVFRGKRQELTPEYKRLLIAMMQTAKAEEKKSGK